jgi:hypothetical protein
MGQLVPSLPRAIHGARSSPNGDDRKLYQASSFKNSSGRSMTSLFDAAAGDSPIPSSDAPCEWVQPVGTPFTHTLRLE